MTNDLRPCPFCGGEAHAALAAYAGGATAHVVCDGCGAKVYGYGRGERGLRDAAESWNRRAERTCLWNGGCGLGVYSGPYDEDTGAYDLPSTIEAHHLTCGHTAYTEGEIPSYCPACGAKVVEVGE